MKPHIRLSRCDAALGRWWLCLSRSVDGRPLHYKAGIGATTQEAYADWARINDVH